jgi:hypothetical protein
MLQQRARAVGRRGVSASAAPLGRPVFRPPVRGAARARRAAAARSLLQTAGDEEDGDEDAPVRGSWRRFRCRAPSGEAGAVSHLLRTKQLNVAV